MGVDRWRSRRVILRRTHSLFAENWRVLYGKGCSCQFSFLGEFSFWGCFFFSRGGSKEVELNGEGSMITWHTIKSAFDVCSMAKLQLWDEDMVKLVSLTFSLSRHEVGRAICSTFGCYRKKY
jgi:hypothetical protein